MNEKLKDVQNEIDTRGIRIKKAGITKLRYPVKVLALDHRFRKNAILGLDEEPSTYQQSTVADFTISASVEESKKGVHMSRFVEVVNRFCEGIEASEIRKMVIELKEELETDDVFLEIEFPYFIWKESPATEINSPLECRGYFSAQLIGEDFPQLWYGVSVPVTTLCPCSKEISDAGAHNQRAAVKVMVEPISGYFIWFEELIQIIETSASSPVWAVLKRIDEKKVTEQAYGNPKFVEDLIRDVAEGLNSLDKLSNYIIRAESVESIHNHNAFAELELKEQK